MFHKPLRWLTGSLLTVALSLSAFSYVGGVVLAAETGFVGQIVQDQVQIYAGGSNKFYVVGQLPKGSQVQVVEVFFGWYKIVPPPGVLSLVPTASVDVAADAKSGTVNADRTEVKAASLKGAAESFRTQTYLDKGAKVQIVGQDGAYYKITPPANAFVYVPPTGLRRLDPSAVAPAAAPLNKDKEQPKSPTKEPAPSPSSAAPASPAAAVKPTASVTSSEAVPATQPVTTSATKAPPLPPLPPLPPPPSTPTTPTIPTLPATPAASSPTPSTETAASTPKPVVLPSKDDPAIAAKPKASEELPKPVTVTKDETPAVAVEPKPAVFTPLQKLSTAEGRFRQATELPLEKQPIAELTAVYQTLLAEPGFGPQEMYLIKVRLSQLDRNAKLAQAITDSASLQDKIKQEEQAAAEAARKAKAARSATNPGVGGEAPQYDFVGQLMASSTYDGTKMPRMFRLIEPKTFRTIAYVRPGPQLDENALLGQWVGIVGQAKYDPALKLNIIEAQQIDMMEPAAAPLADQP